MYVDIVEKENESLFIHCQVFKIILFKILFVNAMLYMYGN